MTRASLLVFAVAVYLVVCYVVAARLSAPVRRPVERTPADFGLRYREVEVRSRGTKFLGVNRKPNGPRSWPVRFA